MSKKIQEDKENTAREFVALNDKSRELSTKRAWMMQMIEEVQEIACSVDKLNGMHVSLFLLLTVYRTSFSLRFIATEKLSEICLYYIFKILLVLANWAYYGGRKWWVHNVVGVGSLSDIIRRMEEIIFDPRNLPWYLTLVDLQTIERIYKTSVRLKKI